MFEAQVLGLLQRYLGKYVYGLDAESLRISVWRGDVELSNLRLKPEALDELNLPVTVKSGLLGQLRLKVGMKCSERLCITWLHASGVVRGSPYTMALPT